MLEIQSCARCDGNPPPENAGVGGKNDDRIEQFINQIERLRREQRAGQSVDCESVSALQSECLIVWYDAESYYERQRQTETGELMKAILGLKANGL